VKEGRRQHSDGAEEGVGVKEGRRQHSDGAEEGVGVKEGRRQHSDGAEEGVGVKEGRRQHSNLLRSKERGFGLFFLELLLLVFLRRDGEGAEGCLC
jgi:hypothetical protein